MIAIVIVGCYYNVVIMSTMLAVLIMGLDYHFCCHTSACIKAKTFFEG